MIIINYAHHVHLMSMYVLGNIVNVDRFVYMYTATPSGSDDFHGLYNKEYMFSYIKLYYLIPLVILHLREILHLLITFKYRQNTILLSFDQFYIRAML